MARGATPMRPPISFYGCFPTLEDPAHPENSEKVYGKVAMDLTFNALSAADLKGEPVYYDTLTPYLTFVFLLDADQQKRLKEMHSRALSLAATTLATTGGAGSEGTLVVVDKSAGAASSSGAKKVAFARTKSAASVAKAAKTTKATKIATDIDMANIYSEDE